MTIEEWREIPGTDYSVSNLGRISSRVRRGRGGCADPVGIMKTSPVNGYPTVMMNMDGGKKRIRVHRLVAMMFISAPPTQKHEVNHKDGNRANARADNLEWVTRSGNQRHRFDVLNHRALRGQEKKGVRLTDENVREIRTLQGVATVRELGVRYGVAHSAISNIWTRKRWGWLV